MTHNAPKTPGSRMTHQRAAIAALISQVPGFVSAQQLHEELLRSGSKIGLATVYRNLQALADEGSLDVVYSDGQNLYRSCETDAHHHHLVCRNCGFTVEVEGNVVEKWAHDVAISEGFTEVTHTVEMYGLCRKCSVARALRDEAQS